MEPGNAHDWKNATSSVASPPPALQQAPGKSRGVLGWQPDLSRFAVARYLPAPELMPFVLHFWTVSWDLRGREPHVQETLPHPNVYLIFERGELVLSGLSTGKFTRLLEGRKLVFGVKFRPGGFRPFLGSAVAALTNRIVPATEVFGAAAVQLKEQLAAAGDDGSMMVHAANQLLTARVPAPDPMVGRAGELVQMVLDEAEIKTVEDLAARARMGKRSLQRLFAEYVGISPKWVIRRYRLHEIVERLNSGEEFNWADVALELGYFDQAHLINDFRSVVGYSPARYQVKR